VPVRHCVRYNEKEREERGRQRERERDGSGIRETEKGF